MPAWLIIFASVLGIEPASQPFFGSNAPATSQPDYFSMSAEEFASAFNLGSMPLAAAVFTTEDDRWLLG